jgi:hypothetical protein
MEFWVLDFREMASPNAGQESYLYLEPTSRIHSRYIRILFLIYFIICKYMSCLKCDDSARFVFLFRCRETTE